MANQPVPNYTRKPYKQLDGGLATRQDPLQVPASQFVQLDNAISADHDVLEKAPGYTLDGSPWPGIAGTSVSGSSPATSVSVPSQMRISIDGDGAQTLNFNSSVQATLTGGSSASTSVSGTIGVNIDGDGVQIITVTGANGTAINNSLYGGIIALIAQKTTTPPWAFLMINSAFDNVNTRYFVYCGSGGTSSSVVITETGSGVATALKLTTGAGAVLIAGTGTYPGFGSPVTPGPTIAASIQFLTRQLTAVNPSNQASISSALCAYTSVYTISSGSNGPSSSVSVTNGLSADTAAALKLGIANGGTEVVGSYQSNSFIRMLANFRVGTSVNSLVCAAQDDVNTNATYKVDLKQSFGDGTYKYIGYTTGTSLFTNGSTAVVGTGTAYNLHLKAGDKIGTGAPPSVWYTISSITDATHLTLSANYAESTTASVAYMARIILSLNAIPVSLVFNNKIIISNGSEKMMEFDNTSMLLLQDSHAPLAKLLEKHKNRVFSGNTPSAPSGLSWSKTNDETVWDAASIASVFPQDNGQLVAIKSFGDSLLCFKDNGVIYRVTGDFDQDSIGAPASIKKLDCPDNLGIIAGKSIVINDDNNLYFSCETGLYTIDPYWFQIKKISWDVSPTLANLIFRATSSTSKQFSYATQSQWNTGTHSGTRATSLNQLSTYNDRVSITGVCTPGTIINPGTPTASDIPPACTIDPNNQIHSVYMTADALPSRNGHVAYSVFGTNNVLVSESLFAADLFFTSSLGIAISSTGQPGIVFCWRGGANDPHIMYTERIVSGSATFTTGSNAVVGAGTTWLTGPTPLTAGSLIKNAVDGTFAVVSTVNSDTSITLTVNYTGTSVTSGSYVSWSNPVNAESIASTTFVNSSVDIRFNGSDPRIFVASVGASGQAYFYSRTGGAWSRTTVLASAAANGNLTASLYVNGSNVSVSFALDLTTIRCWTSSNGGSTFTLLENFTASLRAKEGISVARDGGGNTITGYCDGAIKKRNHSTATTSTIDSTANSNFNGYVFYDGNDYTMNIAGLSPSQTEKYTFLSSSTVSDTNANLLAVPVYALGKSFDNNGAVFVSVAIGTNTGEIIMRRISFHGIWTSPKQSDSTLSAWGTYVVSGEADNGATVLQQIALGATSTLGSPATITSGTLISTDATKIFYQVIVTMTVASFSTPVIGSILLNYLGAGADSTAQTAFVFNNEMYLTVTENGNNSNNAIIFYDRKHAFYRWTHSVSTFARMNQTLYAGSSTNGNVYKMRNGYSYNGTAYTMTAVTKEDMLGSLELNKDIYKIYVLYRVQNSGSFTFSYRTDNYKSASGSAWKDTVVDQTKGGIAEIAVNTSNISSLQMKISQAASVNVQIIGMIIMYGYLNVR